MNIILIAALLPALLLMCYVYKHDRIEREPFRLLLALFGLGALSCIPAAVIESILMGILPKLPISNDLIYNFILCFGIIAVAEEACKLFFLKRKTWYHPDFNYTFDGIVYAVFVGLGFAGLENIMYVMNYGFGVVFSRAILSIPGHCTFAIFMGLFYSEAKHCELYGFAGRSKIYRMLSFLAPVLLHGYYDFCLMSNHSLLMSTFFIFVIAMDAAAIFVIKKESREDSYL